MKYKSIFILTLFCQISLSCYNSFATPIKPAKKPYETSIQEKTPMILLSDEDDIVAMQLSKRDAKEYATIFELQTYGDWYQADKFINNLEDKSLMGHVLYQRYMHPNKYVSSFYELKSWLYTYNDLPNADEIYDLAMKKKPKGQILYIKPDNHKYISTGIVEDYGCYKSPYVHTRWRSSENWSKARKFQREIKHKLKRTMPTRAIERMETSSTAKDILDKVEYDSLQTDIASGYLYVGKLEEALKYAKLSIKRSGESIPEAYWVAGLASWKMGNLQNAADFFSKLYNIDECSPWRKTAAAYWNAKVYKSLDNSSKYKSWLYKATKYPATFYGQLASYELGEKLDLNLETKPFNSEYFKKIYQHEAGRRAIYLINAGQIDMAEEELMGLDLRNDKDLEDAVLSLVTYTKMAQMSLILGSYLRPDSNRYDRYDFAIYPIPSWEPEKEFKVSPALVYAFIKQESRFDPKALSRSGARGLMQLMPDTAKHITGKPYDKDYYGDKLYDPSHNMSLGEEYLRELLNGYQVNKSLILLPVAYNSGPGTLKMWLENMNIGRDPLLFIETIPYEETRTFVKKVLANYWIYQELLGEKNTSAEQIIEGKWPKLSY